MQSKFERSLLESGELIRRGKSYLLGHFGKLIAALTAVVVCLATFTEIGFAELQSARFTAEFLLMLTASYIINFSMESAGEQAAEETETFVAAKEAYRAAKERIRGEDLRALGDFCLAYSEEELAFRKRAFLLSRGVPDGGNSPGDQKTLKKCRRMRAVPLSPAVLLSGERSAKKSELQNPGATKIFRLLLKLLPTTICMTITVSVMLTAKDGLGPAEIINGLMRLSTLPIIALRGYAEGYRYTAGSLTLWVETKTKLLRGFLEQRDGAPQESLFPKEEGASA